MKGSDLYQLFHCMGSEDLNSKLLIKCPSCGVSYAVKSLEISVIVDSKGKKTNRLILKA